MKIAYKLGIAAMVASLLLSGCITDDIKDAIDEAQTEQSENNNQTDPSGTEKTNLEVFVSGKSLSVKADDGTATVVFAEDRYYEETYPGGFCNGNWKLLSDTMIETTCADEGKTATENDISHWEFIGELKKGMTVIIDDGENTMEAVIEEIEDAVNPDL